MVGRKVLEPTREPIDARLLSHSGFCWAPATFVLLFHSVKINLEFFFLEDTLKKEVLGVGCHLKQKHAKEGKTWACGCQIPPAIMTNVRSKVHYFQFLFSLASICYRILLPQLRSTKERRALKSHTSFLRLGCA